MSCDSLRAIANTATPPITRASNTNGVEADSQARNV
jgi:hypothetical protein